MGSGQIRFLVILLSILTLPGKFTAAALVRCACTENHVGILCNSDQKCFGQACLIFNGTFVDARTPNGLPTQVSYASCENNIIRNNRTLSIDTSAALGEGKDKFCERLEFVENSAMGPVFYAGMSCLCNGTDCNGGALIGQLKHSPKFGKEKDPFEIRNPSSTGWICSSSVMMVLLVSALKLVIGIFVYTNYYN